MRGNQELFNKIANEIFIRRKELPKIKEKLDENIKRYEKVKEEIVNVETSLKKLKAKKDEMPNKNNTKILYRFYIPMLFFSLISSLFLAFLTVKLLFVLSIFSPILYVILGILSVILGIIEIITVRLIYLKKLKKSKEKIISSHEYQELLKEIKKIESSLDFKRCLQETEEKKLNDLKMKYNFVKAEITMKEALQKNLIDKGKVSLNDIENKEMIKDSKVHKKVRKKD